MSLSKREISICSDLPRCSFHIVFWVKTDPRRARSFFLTGCLGCVWVMCRICFWASRLRHTRGARRRQFFFFSSNFGDVKIAAGESHRSMKRIIMHEPLTQWKWVLIPDTWLVVVSVLLIYSCLGPTAAEGDPLETQSWCRASGL